MSNCAPIYRFLADLTVIVHLAFILFVVFGALLAFKWRSVIWFHLPAMAWGAATELFSLTCPLTPLEKSLRVAAQDSGYTGDFVAQYLLPFIYPVGLTPRIQMALGITLLLFNAVLYGLLWWKLWRIQQ